MVDVPRSQEILGEIECPVTFFLFLTSLIEAEVDTKVRGYKWTGSGCGMEIL
jgi:hypothetical protein